MKVKTKNRELSWLSFNARLLQEAADPEVPLLERLKFLAIFSSNLDEFFRVRVATLKRVEKVGKKGRKLIGEKPADVLAEIQRIVLAQRADFDDIYQDIRKELERHKIFIVNETRLSESQQRFVQDYFRREVRPNLIPLMIDQMDKFPRLKDHAIYLAVHLSSRAEPHKVKYALIELPADSVDRFIVLPQSDDRKYIIMLDDVIRFGLEEMFQIFHFDEFKAYTIKLTRDAEMDIADDFSESLVLKVTKGLKQRKSGTPVRFVYDHQIPDDYLQYLIRNLKLDKTETNFIPGGRYHNFKDFMKFPRIGPMRWYYPPSPPLPHKDITSASSLFSVIQKQDMLLHYPYQTFGYVIDFLREAAIDPAVTSIKITLYRVASNSKIINALINAAKNGKEVTVSMELQARFDEEANIYWSNRLQEEGVRVIHGSAQFKVHAKLILVTRKVKEKSLYYANIATGNFNESTARLYSDHSLFTADPRLTREVREVFNSLENNFSIPKFRHLLVSPFNMRSKIIKLIETEIKNAAKGKPAYIIAKLNNFTDPQIIGKFYEASQAGVEIRLMVRGMFSLIPGLAGISERIQATGTIDRYLEHSRIFLFCHGGKEKYFLSSADWMPRNLDKRVEAACPVYDPALQQELKDFLNICWADNVKARILNEALDNQYRRENPEQPVRAQEALYRYFQNILVPGPEQSASLPAVEMKGKPVGVSPAS